jgi:hypothetical protein
MSSPKPLYVTGAQFQAIRKAEAEVFSRVMPPGGSDALSSAFRARVEAILQRPIEDGDYEIVVDWGAGGETS